MNKKQIRNAKTFDELLDVKYGQVGTPKRDAFEEKAPRFVMGEMKADPSAGKKFSKSKFQVL